MGTMWALCGHCVGTVWALCGHCQGPCDIALRAPRRLHEPNWISFIVAMRHGIVRHTVANVIVPLAPGFNVDKFLFFGVGSRSWTHAHVCSQWFNIDIGGAGVRERGLGEEGGWHVDGRRCIATERRKRVIEI